jgi:signal transduction histidine kinase
MSLKRRLIFSNAAIVIIPILITAVASFAFIFISSWVFNADVSYENFQKLAKVQYSLFEAQGNILKEEPERLLEKTYQQYLTATLSNIKADIVVLKKHAMVFSTREINAIDLEKCLELGDGGLINNTVELGGAAYIEKAISFDFKDGGQGEILLLTPVGKGEIASGTLLLFTLITFLISFLVTNAVSSLTFSNSILKPLSRLQTAAGEISKGNLNHEMVEDGDTEIKELCRSFEQMRLKLKESVTTQIKYDDNRKMLVSSISHDLKTPITSIKGYVEGIMDGVANTPEKVEKYLKTVYSKAAQVDAMIDDLLLYSKLDLNQIPFHFEKTDIVKYYEDCISEIEPELEKSNIKVSFKNELRECRNVMIDRERARRVIINIIDNAKKYMIKPDGKIAIILREIGANVVIEIKDNGAGIPKEDLPYIFDKFYRADASRSRISGSGLGLAIAKQIIEGHGGKIWVRSQENKGTSIMMSLKKVEQVG